MTRSLFSSPDPKVKVPKVQKTTQKTTREMILELLYINNKLTREDLAKEIGVSSGTIKQHLANLQKDKLLNRVGGRKDGYWKVLDD